MSRRPLALLLGGAAYALALLAIATWPQHVDSSLGIRIYHWYDVIEFVANMVLFMPLGALAMLVSPRMRWGWVVTLGCATSAGIELVQAVVLPGRTGSVQDIVANTLGSAVGAAAVFLLRRSEARSRSRARRAC